MVTVYSIALAAGGVLLLASVLLGHHGAGHGHVGHAGHGGHGGGGHGGHAGHGHGAQGHAPGGASTLLFTFLSLRFWTFASAFFGLAGVIFTSLTPGEDWRVILGIASGVGLVCGYAAVAIVRRLSENVLTSLPIEEGYVGLKGEVLLDIAPGDPGRIRLVARGSLVDMPARSTGNERYLKGSQVLVVEVKDGEAQVAAASS